MNITEKESYYWAKFKLTKTGTIVELRVVKLSHEKWTWGFASSLVNELFSQKTPEDVMRYLEESMIFKKIGSWNKV